MRSPGARTHSHWDTLRRLTQQRLHQAPAHLSSDAKGSPWCSVRRGSYPLTELLCHPAAAPYPPPRPKPVGKCQMSQCRVCYTNLLWEQNVNRSAPSVYNSVLIGKKPPFISAASPHRPSPPLSSEMINNGRIHVCFLAGDDIIERLDSRNDEEESESTGSRSPLPSPNPNTSQRWTMSPPCLTIPYYSNMDGYLQPGLPPKLRNLGQRIRTAPPSPMRPHRVVEIPHGLPVELAKQESLDELRSTVQLAASSMESSTKDIKLLGEKMAAATERMSDTVQDNSQALLLLTQVVDRLQMLIAATRTDTATPRPSDFEQDGMSKKTSKGQRQCPSLTSRFSFPSLPSSSSSSGSLSSCLDAPSTSHRAGSLSGPHHGSAVSKTSAHKKHFDAALGPSKHSLTNGGLDEPPQTAKGGRLNQQKKKRKKAA